MHQSLGSRAISTDAFFKITAPGPSCCIDSAKLQKEDRFQECEQECYPRGAGSAAFRSVIPEISKLWAWLPAVPQHSCSMLLFLGWSLAPWRHKHASGTTLAATFFGDAHQSMVRPDCVNWGSVTGRKKQEKNCNATHCAAFFSKPYVCQCKLAIKFFFSAETTCFEKKAFF